MGIEPATFRLQKQFLSHYTTLLQTPILLCEK
uniref:Uncharacterized protein n=1 Tax=Anguilla anguilla TaxID=7936 RepID=A0A0E9QBI5_ANGAN